MLTDILGNELKEGDPVIIEPAKWSIGRVMKISNAGVIIPKGNMADSMKVPGTVIFLVEVMRAFDSDHPKVDCIKIVLPTAPRVQ